MSEPVNICSPCVGPYCGVFEDRTFKTGGATFRILAHRCYNAFGLFGSEYNGIALLNEDEKNVVFDQHLVSASGYSMPMRIIKEEVDRICGLSSEELRDFIDKHPRSRYVPNLTKGNSDV